MTTADEHADELHRLATDLTAVYGYSVDHWTRELRRLLAEPCEPLRIYQPLSGTHHDNGTPNTQA